MVLVRSVVGTISCTVVVVELEVEVVDLAEDTEDAEVPVYGAGMDRRHVGVVWYHDTPVFVPLVGISLALAAPAPVLPPSDRIWEHSSREFLLGIFSFLYFSFLFFFP